MLQLKFSIMSKGQNLGELLNDGEKIHDQMDQLFIKNNLPTMDLRLLPEEDKKEWYRLKSICDNLSNKMCQAISL